MSGVNVVRDTPACRGRAPVGGPPFLVGVGWSWLRCRLFGFNPNCALAMKEACEYASVIARRLLSAFAPPALADRAPDPIAGLHRRA
jgi:hypothetical protein